MKIPLILPIFLLCLLHQAAPLTFFLEEGTNKCFHEDLPPDADMHGSIKMIDQIFGIDQTDKNQGVRLQVTDPDGSVIKSEVFQDKARFMFTAPIMGRYEICLLTTTAGSWIRENRKYRFQIKVHIGEDNVVISKSAKVNDLAGIQEYFAKLVNEAENFLLRQEIISSKDERLFHDNLETDSKVIFLTILESVALLGLAIYQVLALRRFFIAKNLY